MLGTKHGALTEAVCKGDGLSFFELPQAKSGLITLGVVART